MAKVRSLKQRKEPKEPTEEEKVALREEMIEMALTEIEASVLIAKNVFSVGKPTAEMVAGILDRVFVYEDEATQMEIHEELKKSADDARRLFSEPSMVTPAQVFTVFDWVYEDDSDEGEDEDDE